MTLKNKIKSLKDALKQGIAEVKVLFSDLPALDEGLDDDDAE